jgi:hypothetical protein
MLKIVIVSVVMMVSLLFTYRDVALRRPLGMKELSPYATVRPPLSLRRTSLDTSELKIMKLFHLSGSPSS